MSGFSKRITPSRRWFRRIIVGVVMFLVTTFVGRWIWWERTRAEGEKELAAALAETDALDPRWRWEQIEEDRPEIPDAENSIFIVKQIDQSKEKSDRGWTELPDGKQLLPVVNDNYRFDNERISFIRMKLNEHESIVQLARSLKDYPRGRARLDVQPVTINTSLAHTQACRVPAGILSLEIERLLHDRNVNKVWDPVRAILHAGAALRGEGSLISQLVRMALRTIAARRVERVFAMAEPRVEDLKAMQCHLANEELEELYVAAMRGERAMFTIFFENLASKRISLDDVGDGPNQLKSLYGRLGWKLYEARLPDDEAHYIRTMNYLISIADLPPHEHLKKNDEFESRFRSQAWRDKEDKVRLITTLMFPATNKVVEAAVRDKAILRCAITAIAAERFRIASNKWPTRLDDLCPNYLDRPLLDPFDGEVLKYTIRDDGVTIYSVGADGQDNGGSNLTSSGKEKGTDLGFRLWNVDQRGQPAVPKPMDDKQP